MSAISGQNLARLTISAIESMRYDHDADIFFKYVKEQAAFYPSIEEPRLGRKRINPTYSRIDMNLQLKCIVMTILLNITGRYTLRLSMSS